ncbi:MAG TPA: CE1759 family FMN reductase [Solirubrobacterales bacterium]|nr:CE1759 family FMN reductase [Solirubrobacterales bacterium]
MTAAERDGVGAAASVAGDAPGDGPVRLVVVSAGASDPSSTSMLADRLAARTVAAARERGVEVTVSTIELRTLAKEIAAALVSQVDGPGLEAATRELAEADGIIAATPIYKAGVSGLFKSFFDLLDNDLLIAKPVAPAATAGTARHALVVDEAMRSLFAYMRALTVPTSLFAATEDWADPALEARIERAALELLLLMESGFATQIRERSWAGYQHQYGSAGGTELAIDLDSDLMRLADGGHPAPPR